MTDLITTPNLGADTDNVYAALLQAHDGLDEESSARLNARLILTLANHVGDLNVLKQAIKVAKLETE